MPEDMIEAPTRMPAPIGSATASPIAKKPTAAPTDPPTQLRHHHLHFQFHLGLVNAFFIFHISDINC